MTLPWPLWFYFSAYVNTVLWGPQDRQQQCNGNYSCVNYRHHKTFLFQLANSLISKADISPFRLWLILTDVPWKCSCHAQEHFQRHCFPGQKITVVCFCFSMQMCTPLGFLLYLPLPVLRIVNMACDLLSLTFSPRIPAKIQLLEIGLSSVDLFKELIYSKLHCCATRHLIMYRRAIFFIIYHYLLRSWASLGWVLLNVRQDRQVLWDHTRNASLDESSRYILEPINQLNLHNFNSALLILDYSDGLSKMSYMPNWVYSRRVRILHKDILF